MPYTKLAPYYDILGWADFTDYLWPHIKTFFRSIGGPPKEMLDIACGTGVLTARLADMGVRVTGIDINPEMIRIAKTKNYRVKPEFQVEDMCDFDLKRQFPVVGCFYDAINHITDEEKLIHAINAAARHTEDDGFYLFDINTIKGLKNWVPFQSSRRDSFFVRQHGVYDPETRIGSYKVEAFVKTFDGKVDFIEEIIQEKGYTDKFLRHEIVKAGFKKILIKPFKSDETVAAAERLLFICKK